MLMQARQHATGSGEELTETTAGWTALQKPANLQSWAISVFLKSFFIIEKIKKYRKCPALQSKLTQRHPVLDKSVQTKIFFRLNHKEKRRNDDDDLAETFEMHFRRDKILTGSFGNVFHTAAGLFQTVSIEAGTIFLVF